MTIYTYKGYTIKKVTQRTFIINGSGADFKIYEEIERNGEKIQTCRFPFTLKEAKAVIDKVTNI